jgi:phospho-N-acetylmuramoyl-pentapeptide-transferase
MLFHLFHSLRDEVGFFNVFRYVSTRMGLATLTSLLITFFVAPWFIRTARKRQLGEVIRDDGPATHAVERSSYSRWWRRRCFGAI